MRSKAEHQKYRIDQVARARAKHDESKKVLDESIMLAIRDSVPQHRIADAAGIQVNTIYRRYIGGPRKPRRKPR